MNDPHDILRLAMLLGLSTCAPAQPEAPVACRLGALQPLERAREGELLEALRREALEARERPDGTSVRFAADPAGFVRLAELVSLEHRCCPFLRFSLEWAEGGAAPWLHITGSGPSARRFIADTFAPLR